jgi:hypothetical protein
MINRYQGKCCRCGGKVAAGKGSFDYKRHSRLDWRDHTASTPGTEPVLEHWECKKKYEGTPVHFKLNPDPKVTVIKHV